jgi:hypothetical protein
MENLRDTSAVDRARPAALIGTAVAVEALYQWASALPASADQLYEKDGLQAFTFCIGPNTHLGLVNHTSGPFASGSISGGGNTVPTGSLASGESKEYDLRTITVNMPVTVRINSPSITLPFTSECQPEGGGTPPTTAAPSTTTTSIPPPAINPEITTTIATTPPTTRQTTPKTTTTVKAVAAAPAVTQPPSTPPPTEATTTTLPSPVAITVTPNVLSEESQGLSSAVPTTIQEAVDSISRDETVGLNDPVSILALALGGTGLAILIRRRFMRDNNRPRQQRPRLIRPLHALKRGNHKDHKKVA